MPRTITMTLGHFSMGLGQMASRLAGEAARAYPRKVEIARAIQAARANGLMVQTIECSPDGTIRLSSTAIGPQSPPSAFDQWDEAGKL